jgi:hypothetical protein
MDYRTKDGLLFPGEKEAQVHANGIGYMDEGTKARKLGDWDTAIGNYDMAIPLLSIKSLTKYDAYYNRGYCYLNKSMYDQAIDDFTKALTPNMYKVSLRYENIAGAYYNRAICYNKKGETNQAIADYKKAADLGDKDVLNNLSKLGIQYTPNSGSSSSSSENDNPVVKFFKAIGFEDIDYFGYEINIPVSILLSLVISACITFLAYLIIPQKAVIAAIVSLVLSFLAFACTHKALRVILIIIAVIGLALGVYSFISPSKSKPATETTQTATATVNANVNFRKEPTTGDNIIRQLQQGDTVTLTGETSGGWTQILHNGDKGWVSTEFLSK